MRILPKQWVSARPVFIITFPPSECTQRSPFGAGTGSIKKIESLMKHNKIVAYEARVVAGKRHWEIQVGPDGQKLDHEE
jgi:hypothetical protein